MLNVKEGEIKCYKKYRTLVVSRGISPSARKVVWLTAGEQMKLV